MLTPNLPKKKIGSLRPRKKHLQYYPPHISGSFGSRKFQTVQKDSFMAAFGR
jgi:hypothetical protein